MSRFLPRLQDLVGHAASMLDPLDAYKTELHRQDLAATTRARYAQCAARFLASLAGAEPTPDAGRDFIAALRRQGAQTATVKVYYVAVRGLLRLLGQDLTLKLRREKRLPILYDEGDREALLAAAERGLPGQDAAVRQRNHGIVAVMLLAGLRREEARTLRVQDVHLDTRTLHVQQGKGSKDRTIPIPGRLALVLAPLLRGHAPHAPVFGAVRKKAVWQAVKRIGAAAGRPHVRPHDLRHSYATSLLRRGANVRAIQQLLGHASLETTQVYLDMTARDLEGTVALFDAPPPPARP